MIQSSLCRPSLRPSFRPIPQVPKTFSSSILLPRKLSLSRETKFRHVVQAKLPQFIPDPGDSDKDFIDFIISSCTSIGKKLWKHFEKEMLKKNSGSASLVIIPVMVIIWMRKWAENSPGGVRGFVSSHPRAVAVVGLLGIVSLAYYRRQQLMEKVSAIKRLPGYEKLKLGLEWFTVGLFFCLKWRFHGAHYDIGKVPVDLGSILDLSSLGTKLITQGLLSWIFSKPVMEITEK